jgi:hypothetical protein
VRPAANPAAIRAAVAAVDDPVSSLALAPHSWTQTANFLVAGCLYGALAIGLWQSVTGPSPSRVGPVLVGPLAVGLLRAGVFPTDPVSGYPPGTQDALPGYTCTAAALHDLLSVLTFFGLPAAAGAVYVGSSARKGAVDRHCTQAPLPQ